MDFGTRAKKLRENASLTQNQLARQLGVSASMISFYELRERAPSPDILIKYSKIFHVTTDYLLGLNPEKTMDVSDLNENELYALKIIADTFRSERNA